MIIIKKYIIWFLTFIIIIQLIIIFKHIFPNKDTEGKNIFIKDTNLLIRYEKEIKRDTIIKWYDKIIYKKSEPEKIFFQKTDTVFIEKTKELDLMLQVRKEKNRLIIKAVNQDGKILKEYLYDDIGSEFSAISQKENIFVKSKKLYWKSIYPMFNVQFPLYNKKQTRFNVGLETGISYIEKINLDFGALYSLSEKDILLNSNLKIKF